MSEHDDLQAFRRRCPWDDGVDAILTAEPGMIVPLIATETEWRQRFGVLLDTITIRISPKHPTVLIVYCWTRLKVSDLDHWLGQQKEDGLPNHARIRYGFAPRVPEVPEAVALPWRAFMERCAMSATTVEEISGALTKQPSLLTSLMVEESRLRQGFGPALQAVTADIHSTHQDGLPVISLCAKTSLSYDQLNEAMNRLSLSSSASPDEHIWVTFVHS